LYLLKTIQPSFHLGVHMDNGIFQCFASDQKTMIFSEIGEDCVIWTGLPIMPLYSSVWHGRRGFRLQ
jgi:hypothetical protein